jgi:orotidine-5'-phosphate decarboxylase
MFADRLMESIKKKGNPSVLGLDPRPEMIPRCIKDVHGEDLGKAVFGFNKALIDAVADLIPAVKLQIAFYEAIGLEGLRAYRETADYAMERGLLVIGDIKRGDISSTAEAYRDAHFYGYFRCDAVTLNLFLGYDSVEPFLKSCGRDGKGVFILVKTSNPSSGQLQNLKVGDEYLYQYLAGKVAEWGRDLLGEYGYSSVGAVVGATYPGEIKELRRIMPHTPLLVPGYGAQGASGRDVAAAFDDKGLGAVVNSSRALAAAYLKAEKPECVTMEELVKYTRDEALRMRDDITGAIKNRDINMQGECQS